MKKSKIVPALVLASTFLLAACGPEQEPACSHVDENHDQVCDNCGEAVVTAHTFDQTTVKNENTLKEEANCSHGNIYFKTCECGAIATSETDIWEDTATKLEHVDTDPVDHVCDLCGTTISDHNMVWHNDEAQHWQECSFTDCDEQTAKENHTFGEVIVDTAATCTSEGTGHKICSVCQKNVTVTIPVIEHVDSDKNHFCDVCESVMGTHAEGTTIDHICDYCGNELTSLHVDVDPKDHKCDVCEKELGSHVDTNEDHECDYCEAELEGLHIDADKDHYCDVCATKLSECSDGDVVDHVCDYCGEEMVSLHAEGATVDHKCDVCNKELVDEHYDFLDSNGLCDECGIEMPTVSIIAPCDTIGRGETLHLTAEIDPRLGDASNFEWELTNNGGSRWTLDDNGDGTADLFTTAYSASGTGDHASTVTLTSKTNPAYFATFTGHHSTYGQAKRDSIEEFFGDWMFFPYIGSTTFTDPVADGDPLTAVSTFSASIVGFNKILGALRNSRNFIEYYDGQNDIYHFIGSCDSNYEYCYFDIAVKFDSSAQKTYFTCNKVNSEADSLQVDTIKELLNIPAETSLGTPADGSYFDLYIYADKVVVESDTTFSTYVESLENDGYTSTVSGSKTTLASQSRTTVIEVKDRGYDTEITFRKQEVPAEVEWSKASKNLMLRTFGELLPFVAGGYEDAYMSGNNLVLRPTMVDAKAQALAVFAADNSYIVNPTNSTNFIKTVSDTKDLVITVESDGTLIATLVIKEEQQGDEVAFPLDDVKLAVGSGSANDVIGTEGTKFTFVKNDDYDATVTVEGGDRIAFMQTLLELGFTSSTPRVFVKNNLVITVSTGTTFTINYTLVEIPVAPAWPADAIATLCPNKGILFTQPPVGTITDVQVNSASIVITMTGISGTELKNHINSLSGFTAGSSYGATDDWEVYISWEISGGSLIITVENMAW